MSHPYQYQLLRKDEIRLIKLLPRRGDDPIRCVIYTVSFSEQICQRYSAVSYRWVEGFLEKRLHVVTDGTVLPITRDVELALQYIWRTGHADQWLWMDQICINQSDLAEKSNQVKLMSSIYKRASKLVVWLGDDPDGIGKQAIATVEEACEELRRRNRLNTLSQTDLAYVTMTDEQGVLKVEEWERVTKLLSREWFDRLWVVQEICLPATKDIQVICGDHQVEWWKLAFIHIAMGRYNWWEHGAAILEHRGRAAFDHFAGVLEKVKVKLPLAMLRPMFQGGVTQTLLENLWFHRNRKNGDVKKDRVYALLGISNDLTEGDLPIEYEDTLTIQDLYIRTTRKIIERSESLNILGTCLPRQQLYPDLPSWVTDWSNSNTRPPIRFLTQINHAAANRPGSVTYSALPRSTASFSDASDCNPRVLIVKGYKIGYVRVGSADREDQGHISMGSGAEVLGNILNEFWRIACGGMAGPKTWLMFNIPNAPGTPMARLVESFRRTLIADRDQFGQKDADPGPGQQYPYFSAVMQSISNRKFFLIDQGAMGLGPYDIKEKDIICLFPGAAVPFVLRRRSCEGAQSNENAGYNLVGECYCHGFMEDVDVKLLKEEQFEIW